MNSVRIDGCPPRFEGAIGSTDSPAAAEEKGHSLEKESLTSAHTYRILRHSIRINREYLRSMPKEYAASIEQLTSKINEELKKEEVSPDKVDPLQESINDLAKELTYVNIKKRRIRIKLVRFGNAITRASPKIARTVIGTTSLAPIGGFVGEAFDRIVEDALEEQQK